MKVIVDKQELMDAMLEWKCAVMATVNALVDVKTLEKEEREKAERIRTMLADAEDAPEEDGTTGTDGTRKGGEEC